MNTTGQDEQWSVAVTDPAHTEAVGAGLAAGIADTDVSVVCCWDSSEDAVLGHVVARELDASLGLAVEIEGIVSLLQPLPGGARVALVAQEFGTGTRLAGLAGVVSHAGGTVVAVGAAAGDADLDGTEARDARLVRPERR